MTLKLTCENMAQLERIGVPLQGKPGADGLDGIPGADGAKVTTHL